MRSQIRHTLELGFLMSILAIFGAGACGSPVAEGDRDYAHAMEQEHRGDLPVASPAAKAAPAAPVLSMGASYARIDGTEVKGYLARPAKHTGRLPGIIVIHEWWGLNDNIRSMARQLAAEGYAALAVDLYEGEYAGDRAGALALMQKWMSRRERLDENLRQAHAYLRDQQEASKVGSIGWCFGGGWSLATALLLPGEIDASVIYYGRVVTDEAKLAKLETPILGLFGSEDRGIPVSSVRAFESALERLGKPADIHIYQGADHAFANPSGTKYDAPAAEDAWKRTLAFFAENLR